VRSAVTDCLSIDSHDAGATIAAQHRQDLSNSLPRDLGVAAPEESGRDGVVSIDEEKRLRIAAFEVLLDAVRLFRVKERKPRLSGDRVPQKRSQRSIADEVDHLVRIGEGMPVVGGQEDERVTGGSRSNGALQSLVEECGLCRVVSRLRT
jgi:hypothetical protein